VLKKCVVCLKQERLLIPINLQEKLIEGQAVMKAAKRDKRHSFGKLKFRHAAPCGTAPAVFNYLNDVK